MRRAWVLLITGCGIFHGERVADRPRAPIAADVSFDVNKTEAAPPNPPEIAFVEPVARRATLSNGVRVVLLKRGDLPIANVTVAFARGSSDQPPGVAQVLLHRLHTSKSNELDALGMDSNRFVARDASGIEVSALGANADDALALLGKALVSPVLDPRAIDESRKTVAARLASDAMKPGALANSTALELAGFQKRLKPEEALRVSQSDTASAYRGMVTPDSIVISVVGSFDEAAILTLLENVFGTLRGTAPPPIRREEGASQTKFVLIDRPKSQQASIAVALRAPSILEDEAAAFQLACEVLSARANVLARERKGYSYGVRVTCGALFDPVVFISLEADSSRAHEALGDITSSLEAMRTTPPTDKELAAARVRLGARLVGTFQSNRTASTVLALAVIHDVAPGALTKLFNQARGVSEKEVQSVIERTMTDYRVAIVGDQKQMSTAVWPSSMGAPISVK